MGMTATATSHTRDRVIAILGLINPAIISASPDKPNIAYSVRQKVSIEEAFTPLAMALKKIEAQTATSHNLLQKTRGMLTTVPFLSFIYEG